MAFLVHTFVLMGLYMAFGGDTQEVGYARLLGIAVVFAIVAALSIALLGPWIGLLALLPAQAVMVWLLMQFCYISFRNGWYIAGAFSAYLVLFDLMVRM